MPNELAFTDPQAWKDIYGHRQGHPQFHKDPIHVGAVQDIPGSTTLTMVSAFCVMIIIRGSKGCEDKAGVHHHVKKTVSSVLTSLEFRSRS